MQYGAKASETVSKSKPSFSQISVLTVAVPLSNVMTGVVAGSLPSVRMEAIISAVSRPRFA